MKRLATLLYTGSFLLVACQRDNSSVPAIADPDPVVDALYFKQENTSFRAAQVNCLINRWRTTTGQTSKDTLTLGVINDQAAYQKFFCNADASLPIIDFNTYTLLIGFLSGTPSAGVSNITGIRQEVVPLPSGQYEYRILVKGKTKGAGEWFGFCGLAAKISDPNLVRLRMTYQLD